MSIRLSIITTRTGDAGTTGLGDGSRVDKDTPRVATIGDIDELNSAIGLLRAEVLPDKIDGLLGRVQHDLFDMGAELCLPGHTVLTNDHVARIDDAISHYNQALAPLQEFILPGGSRAAALAHMARTICRRAERAVVTLHRTEPVADAVRQHLNRLSDLCFVLARTLNQANDKADTLWCKNPGP